MERKIATVRGSVEFRDVVMGLDREGQRIHVRQHGSEAPTFTVLARHRDPFQRITVDSLFGAFWPPVYMDDFATALAHAGEGGPAIDVFVLEVPGRAG